MTFEARIDSDEAFAVGSHVGARVDRREIHERLRRIAGVRCALDVEEARWLVVAKRLELHRDHGCASFREYVERVLHHGPQAAAERVRIAEALEVLPATRRALAGGELTYSAVREITRIVEPATEAAWVEIVRGKTAREVEALVAGRGKGDRPEDPTSPDVRTRVVRLELSPESYAMWCEMEKQLGAADDSALVASLYREQMTAGSAGAGGDRMPPPSYQVAVTACAECKRGWQDGGGKVVEIGARAIERARCDAQELGRVDVDTPTTTTTTIPQPIRTRVFRRDHRRCVVPGCRSTKFLEVHHVVFRQDGGGHELSNLALLCGGHHDAVHHGRLVITGDASSGLVFSHDDGRAWGAPPPPPPPAPPPPPPPAPPPAPPPPRHSPPRTTEQVGDAAALVRSALRRMGFKSHQALGAVERALPHVGEVGVEALLRAALRECRPRAG